MTTDEQREAQRAWQQERFAQEQEAWTWLQAHMRSECDKALIKFVSINPHQRGIQWWDVLSIMTDSDGHMDFTEPMAALMEDGEWTMLHTYITYTLIYASRAFAVEYTDQIRVDAVRATIVNNSDTSRKPFLTSTCQRCGKAITLLPYGQHYKWATTPDKKESWHCGNDPLFPVRGHLPQEDA